MAGFWQGRQFGAAPGGAAKPAERILCRLELEQYCRAVRARDVVQCPIG
ncbi:MAG: hypothetical protein FWD68_00655 [Alphaproteobacteria bacterium]|nr:hypothetical protein [Alphaproteobacteria bacterium]